MPSVFCLFVVVRCTCARCQDSTFGTPCAYRLHACCRARAVDALRVQMPYRVKCRALETCCCVSSEQSSDTRISITSQLVALSYGLISRYLGAAALCREPHSAQSAVDAVRATAARRPIAVSAKGPQAFTWQGGWSSSPSSWRHCVRWRQRCCARWLVCCSLSPATALPPSCQHAGLELSED